MNPLRPDMPGIDPPVLVIRAGQSASQYWRDLWRYRELFWFLAWRDVLVRYKQTVIGIAWSFIRPFLTMIIFTVVFGRLAALPSEGAPYPVMVFAALLPWQFFANALSEGSNSLIANAPMLTKVYFPRLIVPASSLIVCLVDFCISFGILLGLMLWYGSPFHWRLATLPLFMLLACAVSFGVSLWFATLNVKFRDFRYVVPFVVQLGLYISPVGFSSAIVPDQWRLLYSLNPMVGIIDGFRWAIVGGETCLYWPSVSITVFISLVVLCWSIRYFRSVERGFADMI
jgi:lipopolysaccharide transport system permease protein